MILATCQCQLSTVYCCLVYSNLAIIVAQILAKYEMLHTVDSVTISPCSLHWFLLVFQFSSKLSILQCAT